MGGNELGSEWLGPARLSGCGELFSQDAGNQFGPRFISKRHNRFRNVQEFAQFRFHRFDRRRERSDTGQMTAGEVFKFHGAGSLSACAPGGA